MTTIQIRIDEKTKKEARKILDLLDIDMSSAIKAYLRQIAIHKGIPMIFRTENGFSSSEEQEIIQASKDVKNNKNTSKQMNIKESIEYLNSL